MEDKKRNEKKRTLTGVVTSVKMDSTVKVITEDPVRHPVYRKVISKRKTYFANTDMELNEGDQVVIREIRPRSKNVRWEVVEKIEK